MTKLHVLAALVLASCTTDPVNHLPDAPVIAPPADAAEVDAEPDAALDPDAAAPDMAPAPDAPPAIVGRVSGRIVVSGPVANAMVSIEELESNRHVGDGTTDADGRFAIEVGDAEGLVRITARGGSFVDGTTTVTLAAGDKLAGIVELALGEQRDAIHVGPIAHLIDARTRMKIGGGRPAAAAFDDAKSHLHRHFGNVDWTWVTPASLADPASSPTESVRAAFIEAGFAHHAQELGVDTYRLTSALASDLGLDGFDGNDGNAIGGGIELGTCAPVGACAMPPTGCTAGTCRAACDVYSGTPRMQLAEAILAVAASPANHTGLAEAALLPFARTINDNTDPDLFAACAEALDRAAPTFQWLAPSPADAAIVRGDVTLSVRALDDSDLPPDVTFEGYPDANPAGDYALMSIDTRTLPDGVVTVRTVARDRANHTSVFLMRVDVDNTPPTVAMSPTGFYDDATAWWSPTAAMQLRGTTFDRNLLSIEARVGTTSVPVTRVGGTWTIDLPAGAIPAGGAVVTVTATDWAGNTGSAHRTIKVDTTPPVVVVNPSIVKSERADAITFAANGVPSHVHGGASIDLGATTCAQVAKYSYLLDQGPAPGITESAKNALIYRPAASDDGVGLAGGIDARVLRGATVVRDWTAVTGGMFGLYRSVVTGLGAGDASYAIELRATDRFGRVTTIARCLELAVLAPPLHFAQDPQLRHAASLATLALQGTVEQQQIAAHLLNGTASKGASLYDMLVTNGTPEPVSLAVTAMGAANLTATMAFKQDATQLGNRVAVSWNCNANPLSCDKVRFTKLTHPAVSTLVPAKFSTRVFAWNGATVGPELVAVGGRVTLPALAAGATPTTYLVMTMLDPVDALQPQNALQPAGPMFVDTNVIGTTMIAGKLSAPVSGCTRENADGYCIESAVATPYRALTEARLSIGAVTTTYAAAVSASTPAATQHTFTRTTEWSTTEQANLPTFIP